MTDEEKTSVESALGELKSALETEGTENDEIQSKMDALITASQAMAQRLYAQAAEEAGPDAAGGGDAGDDDEVVEAEIVDEDDDQS